MSNYQVAGLMLSCFGLIFLVFRVIHNWMDTLESKLNTRINIEIKDLKTEMGEKVLEGHCNERTDNLKEAVDEVKQQIKEIKDQITEVSVNIGVLIANSHIKGSK